MTRFSAMLRSVGALLRSGYGAARFLLTGRREQRGFKPVCLLGDPDAMGPRIFVEWWDTQDWPAALAHLAKLPGVSDTTVESEREAKCDDERPRSFRYEGHAFALLRGCGDYLGEVQDAACPDETLLRIAHHLNHLLCPITTLEFRTWSVERSD